MWTLSYPTFIKYYSLEEEGGDEQHQNLLGIYSVSEELHTTSHQIPQ